MTHPGTRLRAIAARLFDAQTLERYVDPAVADLQAEYEHAATRGQRRESARIWVVGLLAVVQVMSIQGGLKAINTVRELGDDDRRALLRMVLASMTVFSIAALTLIVPFMREWWSHPRVADLAVYLIPQALPLAIPVGLMSGILWSLGRVPASRTVSVLVLVLALGSSLVSFVTLAWVMPNSNQAFRTAVAGGPVHRGANELTLGELRQRIRTATPLSPASLSRNSLALNYHGRWALAAAPFGLAVFGVIFTRGRTHGRIMRFALGPIVIFGYYFIMYAARDLGLDRTISPFAAAWAPNTALLTVSILSYLALRFTTPQTATGR